MRKYGSHVPADNSPEDTESSEFVRQIEAMAKSLGYRLYRGLLRAQAKVWNPDQIPALLFVEENAASGIKLFEEIEINHVTSQHHGSFGRLTSRPLGSFQLSLHCRAPTRGHSPRNKACPCSATQG